MFDKEYSFKGIHAEKVNELTAPFDSNNSYKIFARNVDVYIIAPIIGFVYGRKAEINKGKSDTTTKIFAEVLIKEQTNLKYNYQLIMILSKNDEEIFDNRLNKAFRYYNTEKSEKDEVLYNQYVLGGVDVLYEKIIENAKTNEDYIENIYKLIEDFNERYNSTICSDSILELCRYAKDF